MSTVTQPLPAMAHAVTPEPQRGATVIGRKAFVEMIMGMPISLHVKAIDPERADIAAAAANAFATLRRVDDLFSMWRADSELRRLQAGAITPGECHEWQAEVLDLTLAAEEATDGLFTAWFAREAGRPSYDPTGLVKGWGVEQAAAHLRTVPGISFCLSAGGDMVVGVGRGMRGIAPTWRIGIEDPRVPGRIAATVELTQGAVATSGAAARGAHIVDPGTGERIARPGSTTVVGPDLMWADVWATAAYVDPVAARERLVATTHDYALTVL
ncbi:MAG TPA: FAD:protein FMN transferase [Tetrasphaera sp.]|uniref:FAD:protein FMN transferase n=1 Tax=Nostocoides sp. TaxID=1917966 RepID=UPI002BBEAE9F|nr:FAD:protein FMN transferase [Tetrasphaera sp.]HNQ07585.1 FAD:protein FMN transferase [Tetrasphaera sp.]